MQKESFMITGQMNNLEAHLMLYFTLTGFKHLRINVVYVYGTTFLALCSKYSSGLSKACRSIVVSLHWLGTLCSQHCLTAYIVQYSQ